MDNEFRTPESQDLLNATDAVIKAAPGTKKKNFFQANMIPLKGDSKRERSRKVIFDSLLLVMLCCVLVLGWVWGYDPWHAGITGGERQTEFYGDTPRETQTTPQGAVVEQTRPVEHVRQSFDKLLERNGDCVGWLTAPGAKIDLPIVQTENNDYYLHRNFDLEPSRYGNPFVDYRNSMDPMSTNIIIYGHHMRNGTIFTQLGNYKNYGVVQHNPIITLETPDGASYQYKIFSVLVVNGKPKDDNGYVFAANTPEFPNKESFNGFVRQLKQRSFVNTSVDVQYGDKLISLQTCVYDFDYEFLYVVGRLVRPGESLHVDISQIKKNPNPRVPQALYDKYKQKNPFANAERWQAPK
jgi:sortase B